MSKAAINPGPRRRVCGHPRAKPRRRSGAFGRVESGGERACRLRTCGVHGRDGSNRSPTRQAPSVSPPTPRGQAQYNPREPHMHTRRLRTGRFQRGPDVSAKAGDVAAWRKGTSTEDLGSPNGQHQGIRAGPLLPSAWRHEPKEAIRERSLEAAMRESGVFW